VSAENEKEDQSIIAAPVASLKMRFEKLLDVFQVLGSQQESDDLLRDVDVLIKKFSEDRLENILPPKVVVIQKGRPKNTKRNKLGIEYEDEKIKLEQKKERISVNKKRKVEDEDEDVKIVGASSLAVPLKKTKLDVLQKPISATTLSSFRQK
jgi:hypothetical protein